MQYKVSIIVPVYNTDQFLRKCLDSLVNQTLEEIEIVIIDDGSTDSSPVIIEEYKAQYPRKILHIRKENGGQASARNIGMERCRGEYIGFLDSDDYVSPTMFEEMYRLAKAEDTDYVACGYTDVYRENGQTIVLQQYVASRPCKTVQDMYIDALVSPFLHLYRANIIKESGVRFPEGFIFEDTAFYVNLIPYIKSVATIEKPLAFRLRRKNSTTTTISADRVRQIFPVIDDIDKWYAKKQWNQQYGSEKEYFCSRILLGSSMDRISQVDSRAERKQLVAETFSFLAEHYPQYRKNPYYQHGKKNRVLRHITKRNSGMYLAVLRIRNRKKRIYL